MEAYLKRGARSGAADLERDLLRDHPLGADIGPLFAHLAQLGFDCGAALQPDRFGECRFRSVQPDRRIATTLVELRHDGARLQSLAVRMAVTTR